MVSNMDKRKLRYAFNCVISAAEKLGCNDLHHGKAQQHRLGEVCKAEYKLNKHIHELQEHMKAIGL